MSDKNRLYDFIVIGGGPTGSTVATYLSRYGYSVMVFERAKFPRQHEGESLLPFCNPIFKDLGIVDELKKKFVRKPGVRFASCDNKSNATWFFHNIIPGENAISYHVIRAEFDDLLLKNTLQHGGFALQETRVEEVKLPTGIDDLVYVSTRHPERGVEHWRTRFVIDASGQDTFLAKRLGTKRPVQDLDRIAFLAHWGNGRYIHGLEQGLINIIYLDERKKGWFAIQPVGKDRLSVALIIDRKYLKEQKQILSIQDPDNWQLNLYLQEIQNSPFAHEILEQATIVQKLIMVSDYSYSTDQRFGKYYALLGDAYKFLDPIFATGVFLGMNSAKLFAEAMHQTLQDEGGGAQGLDKAFETIYGAYTLVERFINIFYDPESFNLSELDPELGSKYQDFEIAFSMVHYLLAGDFFTNHEKYSAFLDLLKDPNQFKRWRSLVVSRTIDTDVSYTYEDIFGSIVDA
jgi:flavin-dependent dehydrogenase